MNTASASANESSLREKVPPPIPQIVLEKPEYPPQFNIFVEEDSVEILSNLPKHSCFKIAKPSKLSIPHQEEKKNG